MWRSICACATAVCIGISAQRASAVVPFLFDAATDFSTTVNTETSTWSYRYEDGTTPNGVYPLLPTYGPANGNWSPTNPGAWNIGSSGLPEIGVNRTGGTVSNNTTTPGDNFSLASGTFFMRPVAGKLVVLSWLYPLDVPEGVQYEISFSQVGSSGSDGTTLYDEVRRGDGTVSGHGLSAGTPNNAGQGLGGTIMGPGDRINFLLSSTGFPTTNLTDKFDVLELTLKITSVPEPASFLLFASGMLGLGVIRLRGKFRAQD